MAHPYRPSPPRVPASPLPEPAGETGGMLAAFALLWIPSAARLALAVHGHERFGFEPSLALAITALVPVALVRGWARGR